MLNALNTYYVMAQDDDLDFMIDVLRALAWIDRPNDVICLESNIDCQAVQLYDNEIEWLPQNPFLEPDITPPGYLLPPFYVSPAESLVGAKFGDVVTDLARIPAIIGWNPINGFPRFRLDLTDAKSVSVTFVTLFGGGMAQWQVDGELGSLKYIDLNRDISSIPPETNDEVIVSHEFQTTGAHFLDVAFVPTVSEEIIGFGGGIRRIEVCRFDDGSNEVSREIELNSVNLGNGCQQIQWRYVGDAQWLNLGVPVCNGQNGLNGADGVCADCTTPPNQNDGDVPPPGAAAPAADAACQVATAVSKYVIDQYRVALQAYTEEVVTNGRSLLDFGRETLELLPIFAGVTAVTNFFAWIAAMTAGNAASFYTAADGVTVRAKIRDLLYCQLPTNGDLTASVLTAWKNAILADVSISFRSDMVAWMENITLAKLRQEAQAAVGLNIAHSCTECSWCYVWDFAISNGGWNVQRGGEWQTGVGWKTTTIVEGSARKGDLLIQRSFAARTITRVRVTFSGDNGTISLNSAINNQINLFSGSTNTVNQVTAVNFGSNIVLEWTGNAANIDRVLIQLQDRFTFNSSGSAGTVRATSIRIEGKTSNPFGSNNC